MKISSRLFDLKLAHRWAIAGSVQPGGAGGIEIYQVVFVELTDADGATGTGEAAPSSRYEENAASALEFLARVDALKLSFADVPGSKVEAAGAKALCVKDAEPLGRNIIHSVTNPIPRLSAAIHVYGGDFFAADRSEWDPETLSEQRYDVAKNMQLFDKANAAHAPA